MPLINLKDIPVYYINMEEAVQRHIEIKNVIKEFGFKKASRIEGPKEHPPASGLLEAVSKQKPPFIVLEDDCRIKTKNSIIEIPEFADCVYLGICDRAFIGTVQFFQYNRDLVKLHDMLSTHAMLFLTEEYCAECIRVTFECVRAPQHVDIAYSKIMKDWNVYALAEPIFYQEKCVLRTNIRFKTDCPYIDDSRIP